MRIGRRLVFGQTQNKSSSTPAFRHRKPTRRQVWPLRMSLLLCRWQPERPSPKAQPPFKPYRELHPFRQPCEVTPGPLPFWFKRKPGLRDENAIRVSVKVSPLENQLAAFVSQRGKEKGPLLGLVKRLFSGAVRLYLVAYSTSLWPFGLSRGRYKQGWLLYSGKKLVPPESETCKPLAMAFCRKMGI